MAARSQINDQLMPRRAGGARRAGFGGAAPSASVQAALNLGPEAATAWTNIQSTMQDEGWRAQDVDNAANKFVQTYNVLNNGGIIGDGTDPVSAAASFTSLGHTIGGAVSAVEGLVSAASGGSVPQAMNAVMGLVVSVAPAAAAAGAVSLGVGAAIVVGAALVETVLSNIIGSPPKPAGSVGNCQYYGTTLGPNNIGAVNYVWSWGKPVPSGPTNALWRRFPDPSKAADAGWFAPYDLGGALPASIGETQSWWWTAGQQNVSDEWYACFTVPTDIGKRPIDQLCYENGNSVYHHLECEVANAKSVPQDGSPAAALAGFQQAFFAAWRANREYGTNGLAQQPDYVVLQQSLILWNNAHSSSQTVTIPPSTDAPLGAVMPCPSPQLWSLLHLGLTPYAAIVLGQNGGKISGGILVNGNIVLNAGPKKTRVDGSEITKIGWGPGGWVGGKSASSSSSSTATSVALGAAAVAGAGLLGAFLYARHKRTTTKAVLKTAWNKTGGRIHVPHHLPKLLGRKKR